MKNKFKSDITCSKSKKVMSISTLKSTQQRRRRRRRRQLDLNVSTDCSLEGHYNFIENSSGFHSASGTRSRKSKKPLKSTIDDNKTNTLKAVQNSGLVNTKINVYEKNLGSAKDNYKQLHDSRRKKKVLGVPLVGMHNTNSTNVSRDWNNQNFDNPSKINIPNGEVLHSSKIPSINGLRKEKEKTSTKRRAPAIPTMNSNGNINSEPSAQFKRNTTALTKDNNYRKSYNSNASYPTKFTKNPYSTSRNGQSRHGKDFYNHVVDSGKSSTTIPAQFINLRCNDDKRKTLYAKDADGEEAIRVLTNLCLNPLARNSKRASFMMW